MIVIMNSVLFCVLLLQVCGSRITSDSKDLLNAFAGLNGNNQPIVEENGYLVFTISVGNPLQDINVVLDTNNGLIIVPDSKCACVNECNNKLVCLDRCSVHCCNRKAEGALDSKESSGYCTNKNVFETKESKTFQANAQSVSTSFDGEEVKVNLGVDSIRLGPSHNPGIDGKHIQFGTVKDFSNDYEDKPFDGILGLGRLAPNDLPSSIKQILEQHSEEKVLTITITKNFKLDQTEGVITFGEINEHLCNYRSSQMVPLINKKVWSFRMFSVNFNQTTFRNLRWTAKIDLNSPYITVPKVIFNAIEKRIGVPKDNESDEYIVPYDNAYKALLNNKVPVGSYEATVPIEALLVKTTDMYGRLYMRSAPEDSNEFILGRPFFNNKCVFLDYGGRIGFSPLK